MQETIEYHPDEHGGFYTTSLFWECRCDGPYYIYPQTQGSCPYCGDCRGDGPDARVSDVLRQTSSLDEGPITLLEEAL